MKLKGANPRGLLVQPTLNPSVLRCGYARSVIAFDGSKSTKRCFGLRDGDWTKTRGFGERGLVTGNGGLERFLRGLRERIARASRYWRSVGILRCWSVLRCVEKRRPEGSLNRFRFESRMETNETIMKSSWLRLMNIRANPNCLQMTEHAMLN